MFSGIYAIPVTELGGLGTHASVAMLVANYCMVDSGHPCAIFDCQLSKLDSSYILHLR